MFDFSGLNDVVEQIFGEAVILKRSGQPDLPIVAVYDSLFYAAPDGEAGGASMTTSISVRASEVGIVKAGAVITARSRDWRVTEARPDAEGIIILVLEKA